MSTVQLAYLVTVAASAVLLAVAFSFAYVVIRLRRRNERNAAHWSMFEATWAPRLLQVIEDGAPAETLLEEVRPEDRLYFVEYLTRFGKRVKGAELERVRTLAGPYLPTIAERTLGGDAERRARAVQTLGVLAGEPYRPYLVGALDDPAPLVAMTAAWAIMKNPEAESVAEVVEHLERFENWSPPFLASMLSSVGAVISPSLRRTLDSVERPPWVRVACADALRSLYDPEAGDVAASILTREHVVNEPDSGHQLGDLERRRDLPAACLRLLNDVGRPEHLPAATALVRSPDFVLRALALSVMGKLGTAESEAEVRRAFDDENPWVAVHAARALRDLVGRAALDGIVESGHPRSSLARQVLEEAAA